MQKNKNILSVPWSNIPVILSLLSIITILIGAFIVIKLAPVYKDISGLDSRVLAVEERNARVDPYVERFLQLEQRDELLVEDVQEIKDNLKELIKIHNARWVEVKE